MASHTDGNRRETRRAVVDRHSVTSAGLELMATAPPDWDTAIASPLLSDGFAQASRHVGFRPLFVRGRHDRALVLLRAIPIPVIDRLTRRAKVYVNQGDASFVKELIERLAELSVTYVRVGDERHGVAGDLPDSRAIRSSPYHVFLIDPKNRSDEELLAAMSDPVPRNIRKTDRAGVEVTAIRTEADMAVFCALMRETVDRMRRRRVSAVYPQAFFRAIFREMVPRGQALFLLARWEGKPLAAQLYFIDDSRLTYYHGASTRARELTPKQGPTAIFWYAIRLARDLELTFDMGAGTPTSDPANVHFSVTDFKRRWGGRHVEVPSIEVVLAPKRSMFQERLLKPLWDRAYPMFMRLFGHVEPARGPVGAAAEDH